MIGNIWYAKARVFFMKSIILSYILSFSFINTAQAQVLKSTSFVSTTEIDSEHRWLKSLGINAPQDYLLEDPFNEPFTAQSFIVPTQWYINYQLPTALKAADVLADLPYLKFYFEKGYAAYNKFKNNSVDWDLFFRDWEVYLKNFDAQKIYSVNELFLPYFNFKSQHIDNHTSLVIPGVPLAQSILAYINNLDPKINILACTTLQSSGGKSYQLNSNDLAQVPQKKHIFSGRLNQFKKAYTFKYPSSFGLVKKIFCDGSWFDVTLSAQLNQKQFIDTLADINPKILAIQKDLPTFEFLNAQTGYLRLPHFSILENAQKLMAYSSWLPKDANKIVNLIIDLRRNGGGGGSQSQEIINKILDNQAQIRNGLDFEATMISSCLSSAMFFGQAQAIYFRQLKLPSDVPNPKDIEFGLKNLIAGSFDTSCSVLESKFYGYGPSATPKKYFYKNRVFPSQIPLDGKRIVVLVDNYCSSDCEGLVESIANIPGATVIGQNTYGVAEYVQPGYVFLPHTRILSSFAQGIQDAYGDGRSFDGYGFDVDILIEDIEGFKKDSLLKILDFILQQESSTFVN